MKENNEGKYYITVTAEAYGTTGQLCLDGHSTSDLCFEGADVEFDTFEEAKAAAEKIDLNNFVDWVLEEMKFETVDTPAGGHVTAEVMEGDGGLVGYKYEHTDGGFIEIKSIRVGFESAQAGIDVTSSTSADLCADCPECGLIDAYVSSGEHAENGGDFVQCSGCGNWFYIHW